jgi:hypothetical protein
MAPTVTEQAAQRKQEKQREKQDVAAGENEYDGGEDQAPEREPHALSPHTREQT